MIILLILLMRKLRHRDSNNLVGLIQLVSGRIGIRNQARMTQVHAVTHNTILTNLGAHRHMAVGRCAVVRFGMAFNAIYLILVVRSFLNRHY